MLAPCYKRTFFRSIRSRESTEAEKWFIRAQEAVQFLRQEICTTATIIALQEFWLQEEYYSIFRQVFETEGFEVKYLRRTGAKTDAVALLIRKNVFDILGSENISLCGQNDRVALLLWLQHKLTGRHFVVVNTHLSFPHSVFDKMSQVRQMQTVTEAIDRFALRYRILRSTRIILGDFNVENQSPVCEHLRTSGYTSCFDVSPPTSDTYVQTNTSSSASSASASTSSTAVSIEKVHISLPESYFDDTAPLTVSSSLSSFGNSSDFTLDQEHSNSSSVSHSGTESNSSSSIHLSDNTEAEGRINETAHAIPFDSHAAFVQSRLELLRQTRLLRSRPSFVSHFNHRQEEVGVDHIFIQPEAILDPTALRRLHASVASGVLGTNTNSSSGNDNNTNMNMNMNIQNADVVTRTVISANTSYTTGSTGSSSSYRNEKSTGVKSSSVSQGESHYVLTHSYVPTHATNQHSSSSSYHSARETADACPLPDNRTNFTRPGLEDERDDEQQQQQQLEQSEASASSGDNNSNNSNDTSIRSSPSNNESGSRNNHNSSIFKERTSLKENLGSQNPKPSSIFIAQCQVLPASLTSKVWHPEFQISDHRPISATFVIAEKTST